MAGKRDIPINLGEKALKAIVDSPNPIKLIQKAKKNTGGAGDDNYGKPLSSPDSFTDVTGYKDWRIVQNNTFKNYALLDSDDIVRVKYFNFNWNSFRNFLEESIRLGEGSDESMIIYQVVTNKTVKTKEGCEVLTEAEAKERFPNSIDLASGFFLQNIRKIKRL
jgi:hypothetical protein